MSANKCSFDGLLIKVPGVRIPDGSPIERPVKPHEYAICGFFAYIKLFLFFLKILRKTV